jgi:hypothetical protein
MRGGHGEGPGHHGGELPALRPPTTAPLDPATAVAPPPLKSLSTGLAAAALRPDLVAGRPDPAASDGGGDDPWMGSAGRWMGSPGLFMDFFLFCFFIGLTMAGMATASVKVTIYRDL